jgi:hypothetical protein
MSDRYLEAKIAGCKLDWRHASIAPEDQLVLQMGISNQSQLPAPSAIRWFHATRAPIGTTFEEGLLPTLAALPKLWDLLGQLASQWMTAEQWGEYRSSFDRTDRHFAQQFPGKCIAPGWEGPFAFLVKDAALHRHDAHKDFTRISEVAEDICADFEQVHQLPLRAAYEAATRPCLVVFTTPGDTPGTIKAALNYVHRALNGLEHGYQSNTNFSGRGTAVPAEWIDRVEWL